jgi:hypothetical protein
VKPLTPPDLSRCQADVPNGHSFMTLGGRPGLERCTNATAVVVEEREPGSDGQRGSMGLCGRCLGVAQGGPGCPGNVPAFIVHTLDQWRKTHAEAV